MPPNPGTERVTVIGGGLAGSEAAMMIARLGHPVDLYEMKPKRFSPAHTRTELAEIVCSNSLGNEADDTAPGLLKSEMRRLGSVILAAAGECRVPAGRALAVDRERFSKAVTARIAAEPRIRLLREECLQIPEHQP
ncbi:MAG TPA: FAD-dependent oxidoreductase, partial [Bdellovibrionota bacterium]|nr:FAD-dependent oxidoreductase [Bdellovibrionota bacterium]